jgi:hypothetical protein
VPGAVGAVYVALLPAPNDTEPPPVSWTLQVTAVLVAPFTVALRLSVSPRNTVAAVVLSATVTAGTVIVQVAVFAVSATLVATTVYVPGVSGAV